MTTRLIHVLLLGLGLASFPSFAGLPKKQKTPDVTGLYTNVWYSDGSYYGHNILIYQCVDYWAIHQYVVEQEGQPVSAHASVRGNEIEFKIEIERVQFSTFKGKILNGFLVGEFDTSSEKLKLKKVPLRNHY